jgi:hypothetical protein
MEEVAPMEIYTMTQPSTPLNAACIPSAVLPFAALPFAAAAAAPVAAAVAVTAMPMAAAPWAPIPQAHQVLAQAELARTRVAGISSTTGFKGLGRSVDSKRYVDERGVPPRGRPV